MNNELDLKSLVEKIKWAKENIFYPLEGEVIYNDGEKVEISDTMIAYCDEGAIRQARSFVEAIAERGELIGAKYFNYGVYNPKRKIIFSYK